MSQLEKYKFNNEPIRVLEFFSGVGMQRMAFDKLGVNYESVGTSEIDIPAILSYASIHDGLLESDESFEYPSKEEMLSYLSERNIGLDFKTGKLKLPKNLDKIKQLYRAVILSKCFGDISKINPSDLPDFDFMTYSSPCQDFSVAGKQQGAIKGQTRSGLLYECEKVIEHKRPKYLLLENVKNLVGKQFKPQFDEWLDYLESLGYTNYWKVLNSKSFGVPQNRERVFVLSILGEHDPYEFHNGFELNIKLKNILESNVDEKYYLSKEVQDRFKPNKANQVIEKLMTTNQINDDLVTCDLSVDDPKVKDVSNCVTARQDRGVSNQKSVGCGVVERIICEQRLDEGLRFFKDDVCGCLRTIDSCGDKRVIELQPGAVDDLKINVVGTLKGTGQPWDSRHESICRVYDQDGLSPTISTCQGGGTEPKVIVENLEPLICASRGRNPENPSDRTVGIHLEQRLEINYSGTSNTITTVQKDNYVLEPNVLRPERTEYGKAIRKQYENGEITEKIGNMREYNPRTDGITNTLTTVQKDNYLFEPQVSTDTYKVIDCGHIPYETNTEKKHQSNTVYSENGLNPTLNATDYKNPTKIISYNNFRIRKLTPKECWRLMGIDDECFDKAQQVNSNSQLYKQAGNGIVVDVLYYIFKELFKNNNIE